jgi:hypothetical protein
MPSGNMIFGFLRKPEGLDATPAAGVFAPDGYRKSYRVGSTGID